MALFLQMMIFLSFYVLGAYATTDILRLLKGNETEISQPDCFCESCGCKIPLWEQVPIFSYLLCQGKCRRCGAAIVPGNFILEILFTLTFSMVSCLTHFSLLSFFFCILFYEGTKAFCIVRWGKRGKVLLKGILHSIPRNILNFALIGLLFFFHFIAEKT